VRWCFGLIKLVYFRAVLDVQSRLRICQKYFTLKEDKRIWKMRHEYFAVYVEYGN